MVKLLRVYAIGMLYAKWMLKNKLFYIYLTLFMPLSILVPFYLIASENVRPYVAVGTIVFTLLSNALATACQDLAVDKLLKRIAVLLSKPISSTEYFLGQLLSNALQIFPATATVIIALCIAKILEIHNLALFVIGLLLGWYVSTAMGFAIAIALSSRDYNTIIIVSNVIAFAMVFLAPIYYPPSHLPELARILALAVPSMHVANAIGYSCGVNYMLNPRCSLLYLSILAIVLTIVIAFKVKLRDMY